MTDRINHDYYYENVADYKGMTLWQPSGPVFYPAQEDWEFCLNVGDGAHVMLSDIRKFGGHGLLKAEKGACIVLSINDADDGLTLYTGEQVDAISKQTGLMRAATAVCNAWNEDLGAEAVKQAIAALTREVVV